MSSRILICDDEEGMRRYLAKMLQSWGHRTDSFSSPLVMLKALEDREASFDLALVDIKMPEMDGLEALGRIRALRPEIPVVMMTGHGTIESAVEAMKVGAYDYLTKPFPQEKLFALIQHCLEGLRLREENASLKRRLKEQQPSSTAVYRSESFGRAFDLALQVADSDSSVLILGESGTGKEVVATAIHEASPRAENRFLAVNCAAFSEPLLESQLFGHVKGAFTGATQSQKGLLDEAHEGTLFLDEVGDLSPTLQAKLLRVLQLGEFIPVGSTRPRRVNVRFVAATNKDLPAEVAQGRFREDLYYRLNVISIELPALRHRPEDIEPLAQHFLNTIAGRTRHRAQGITPEALETMKSYRWPGNVRELENVIERGTILARGGMITSAMLPFAPQAQGSGTFQPENPLSLREAQRRQVVRALTQTGWNKSQAAVLLDVTRKTLDRKIKDFNLSPADQDLS